MTAGSTVVLNDPANHCLEARQGETLRATSANDHTLEGQSEINRMLSGGPKSAAPRAILMAGMPGAGKTTLARAFEEAGMVRLCPDEEMFSRYGHYGRDFPRGQFRVREAPVLKDIALKLQGFLTAGRDVVVDHGFWTPEDRSHWATSVREAGGAPVLVYLPVPHDVRWERIRERNLNALVDPNSIEFSEEDLRRFEGRFYPPTADEPHILYDGDPNAVMGAVDRALPRPGGRH